MASEAHINDEGLKFKLTLKDGNTVVDISSATVKQITFKNSECTVITKNASFETNGTDGIIYYTTVSGDLNVPGTWRIQGYVVLASGKYHSDVHSFRVYENLE